MRAPVRRGRALRRGSLISLHLSYDFKFKIQPHTSQSSNSAADLSNERRHIRRTRQPSIHHEVGMLRRDFRIADACALEADCFDQTARGIARRVLEYTTRARHRERLRVP